MTRSCAVCGTEFDAKSSRAKFCGDTCRQRKHRGAVPDADDSTTGPPEDEMTVVEAVRAELVVADKIATVNGQLALRLARKIDKSVDTGSGIAALIRELKLLLTEATGAVSGSPVPASLDEVDELRVRRDAKLATG